MALPACRLAGLEGERIGGTASGGQETGSAQIIMTGSAQIIMLLSSECAEAGRSRVLGQKQGKQQASSAQQQDKQNQ